MKGIEVLALIKKRYSGRNYDNSKPVSQEQINALIEAAQYAPSCFNEQPWRYIICDRKCDIEAWNKALNCLSEKNKLWVVNCPVIIISFYKTKWSSSNRVGDNIWALHDVGAANYSLVLQAFSMGMMAHEMGGFDFDKIIKDFSVPEGFKPITIISVGYEKAGTIIPEKKRESKDKLFFYNKWQQ